MILEAVNSLPPGRILVAPLNWGLGHATRCVPLIRTFLSTGHSVVIAASGGALTLLRSEFPALEFVEFEGIHVHYSGSSSQIWSMIAQSPSFLYSIWHEHRHLSRIIEDYNIDIVFSDNRFGLWSRKAYSVYMTHQLMVRMPHPLRFLEPLVWRLHRCFISHYDQCWVPDFSGEKNLSGDLSHKYPLLPNTRFIGPLSRFSSQLVDWTDVRLVAEQLGLKDFYSTLVVVSGPEPHRGMFVSWAVANCPEDTTLIVAGVPDASFADDTNSPKIVPHLPTQLMQFYLQRADKIICRSGYSSIMDLYVIGRKAELIPTPGQTEQEYLKTLHG